jgi:hypothetical protein
MTNAIRCRWYRLTPDRFILGLLLLEGFLLLSEQSRWFAFDEHKGWTVLIAAASVALAIPLILLWCLVGLLFRQRVQFSLRSLLTFVLVCAVACSWLATEMRQARKQKETVEAIEKADFYVYYDD